MVSVSENTTEFFDASQLKDCFNEISKLFTRSGLRMAYSPDALIEAHRNGIRRAYSAACAGQVLRKDNYAYKSSAATFEQCGWNAAIDALLK